VLQTTDVFYISLNTPGYWLLHESKEGITGEMLGSGKRVTQKGKKTMIIWLTWLMWWAEIKPKRPP